MRHIDIKAYRRIILVGSCGSGKSWMSKRIAYITGYPLTHLDKEYWQPDWVKTPRNEWIAKQEKFISGECWIIDGNYDSTMELRYAAADLVIFLDINRLVCILGAAKRNGKKRSDLPEYLDEHSFLSKEFLEFCGWIWIFRKGGRKTILTLHEKYPNTTFLHIKRRSQVKRLLKEWEGK